MWQPGTLIEDFINTKHPIIDVLDDKRRTPLSYAALYNNNEALEILLNHGARVNMIDSNGSLPIHQALKGSATTTMSLMRWDAKIKSKDGFRQTCLQIAIRSQISETVNLVLSLIDQWEGKLVKRGWEIGSKAAIEMIRNRDIHGKTALHRLCASHDFSRVCTFRKIRLKKICTGVISRPDNPGNDHSSARSQCFKGTLCQ